MNWQQSHNRTTRGEAYILVKDHRFPLLVCMNGENGFIAVGIAVNNTRKPMDTGGTFVKS